MSTFEIISLIASGTSGLAAAATGFVSWRIYQLQKTVEDAKSPQVHIWYSGTKKLLPRLSAEFSFANLGQTPLLIRRLRILGNNAQAIPIAIAELHREPLERDRSYSQTSLKFNQEVIDVILEPGKVQILSFEIETSQMKVEVMYYDNSFEFVDVDTANLGGKYVLTGKGKKL
jgi:hypothetical protein